MRGRRLASLLALAVLLAPALLVSVGFVAPPVRAASAPTVGGSITGPTVVPVGSSSKYQVLGYGGPAYSSNGTLVGNISYYTTLVGNNLTGASFSPPTGNFTGNRSIAGILAVGNATETITIDVMVSSVYQGKNESTNFSLAVSVVQPYVISTSIIDVSTSTVLAFVVYVTLDGTVVGNVTVPTLQPGGKYPLSFEYSTVGLSPGDHTFALSLVQEHGLVTFPNGSTVYSQTVYVTGPGPDYTLWYVLGIVAFFGALFIFATRVAARRRGATRR